MRLLQCFLGYTLLCVVLSVSLQAQNQQVTPASPNASSLGQYVDNPVSLYTGIPSISIPLFELKEKDISLPISLSYHADGIKVEQVASSVGLGWTLNAGGVITRVVKDVADDKIKNQDEEGNCAFSDCSTGLLWNGKNLHDIDLGSIYNNSISNGTQFRDILLTRFYQFVPSSDGYYNKTSDSEPDVFYFNFAGKTGKFIFSVVNGNPQVKLFPHQNLVITYSTT